MVIIGVTNSIFSGEAMDIYINKILKQMAPLEPPRVDAFACDNIAIFKANVVFNEAREFDDYEFIIPSAKFPAVSVDRNKSLVVENNKLFPINPQQLHSAIVHENITIPYYLPLFIDKTYFQEIAYSIFGDRNVFFENKSVSISKNLQGLISLFMQESEQKQTGYQFILQSLTAQIVITLIREVKNNFQCAISHLNYTDKKCINTAISFLVENYQRNITLDEIAKLVNYSPYHFIRIFKAETGKTPLEFFQEIKIEKAKELLKRRKKNITEICHICGFNNPSHFTNVFRRKVGTSPTQFRKDFFK
ncbi:MAG: helix-turn-helix transcriptional regulator [Firmicutes bacterium]|nr:helix-turn-helix transcriptional regulator [Bacillota bacterium]